MHSSVIYYNEAKWLFSNEYDLLSFMECCEYLNLSAYQLRKVFLKKFPKLKKHIKEEEA